MKIPPPCPLPFAEVYRGWGGCIIGDKLARDGGQPREMQDDIYRRMYEVEGRHWWYSGKRAIIRSLLDRYVAAGAGSGTPRVADLGCGCGRMLEELGGRYEAVGVDVSQTAIEFCAMRGVKALLGALPDGVPLEDGTFDAVIMSDILEHVEDDAGAAKRAGGLLRAGGVMIVTAPAYEGLWSSWDEAHRHKRRYTAGTLRRALEGAGLDFEFMSYYNTVLFPAAAAARLAKRLTGRGGTIEMAVPPEWLNSALRAVFASERHVLGRAPLPFGLSVVAVLRRPQGR